MKKLLFVLLIAVFFVIISCKKTSPASPEATATISANTATQTATIAADTATATATTADDTATATATVTATSTATVVPELFFSEYVEGTSNNKAIEIYNAGTSTASLDGVSVRIYANGSATVNVTLILSGTINSGDVFVVANPAGTGVVSYADMTSASLTFNGNDAVELAYMSETLDIIGQIGYNPGAAWGSGQEKTFDATLKRKCFVTAGDTNGADTFDPAVEWAGYPLDTFTGLGTYDCGPDSPTATRTYTASPITTATDTATVTETATETETATITATATSTSTPNYVLFDNFTDGNLQNAFGNDWSPRTPFVGTWALVSVTGSGYNGNSLYVTCYAKASVGSTGAYFSFAGTSTYIANTTPVSINPVNTFDFMGRFDVATETGAQGTYGMQIIFNTYNSTVSAYNSVPLAVTNGAWASYSIDLDSLTYSGGTKEQLFNAMGFIQINLRYTTPVQNEVMTAEFYLDDLSFNE